MNKEKTSLERTEQAKKIVTALDSYDEFADRVAYLVGCLYLIEKASDLI